MPFDGRSEGWDSIPEQSPGQVWTVLGILVAAMVGGLLLWAAIVGVAVAVVRHI